MRAGETRILDTVIVGGGITGLAAAHFLEEVGRAGSAVDYLLLEQAERLGGKILTEREEGFLLDAGPDCFVTEKPGVIELATDLGIADRLLPSNEAQRGTYVLARGRVVPLPEGLLLLVPTRLWPFLSSPLVSWRGKLRMALDLVLPRRRDGADESLEEFVLRRLGREALDRIAEPLVAGIHAGDPRTMSVRASFPRFIKMEEEHGSLIRAMLAVRRRPPHRRNGAEPEIRRTFFMSFRSGMGELTSAVQERLSPGRFLVGARVNRIRPGRDGEADGAPFLLEVEGIGRLAARTLVLATPSFATAALLEELDPALAALVGAIPTVSTAVVHLAFRRAELPPLRGFGVLIPRVEGRRIKAVTYSSVKWEGRVPDPSLVLMRIFVGGPGQEHLVDLSRDDLVGLAAAEVRSLLGFTAAPLLARVHRWPRGLHQYVVGHLARLESIGERLQRWPGLFLAGSAYRGIGAGDCIRSGREAARAAVSLLLAQSRI